MAQLVSTAAWPIAISGSVSLGAGIAWAGYRLWQEPRLEFAPFSYIDVGVSSQCRCRLMLRVTPPLWSPCICNCRHLDSNQARRQHSLTMAKFLWHAQETRGSHDDLYATRVYRQDRRRLLRRLRQSSGRSPLRSSSGFGGVTRSCRRAWPNGGPSVDTRPCPCQRGDTPAAGPSCGDAETAVIHTTDGRSRNCRPCCC